MSDNNFLSIDKLVEFGMSMAVAQQMVQTMNHSIQNTHIPGAMNPIEKPKNDIIYVIIDDQQSGPYSEKELMDLIKDKKIFNETYIWIPGLPEWKMAEQVPEIVRLVALSPPPFN